MEVPIYYSEVADCYGLYYFVNIYTMKITGQTIDTNPCLANAQRIINYKKSGKESVMLEGLIKFMAYEYFKCSDIVAIPSSTTKMNYLQKAFGVTIERTYDVEKQKNTNTRGITNRDKASFDFESVKLNKDNIQGKKILLVDDVCKSGSTMQACRDFLIDELGEGTEVICFAFGVSYNILMDDDDAKRVRKENHANFEASASLKVEVPDEIMAKKGVSVFKANQSMTQGNYIVEFDWFKSPTHRFEPETIEYLKTLNV